MRLLIFLLILPISFFGQLNPLFIFKSDLNYNKVEYKGEGLFGFEINDKFGYMDKTGKIIIPADFLYSNNNNSMPFFYKGVVAIKKDTKMGVIDKTGKIIIPFEYDIVYTHYHLNTVFYAAKKENSKIFYGVINLQNKEVIPIIYEEMLMDSNLVKLKKDGKWGLFDFNGKQILPIEYDAISTYSREKLIQATKGDQLKFMNTSGKLLFEKAKKVYTINGCNDGMIRCKVNDKYGYLDLTGNEMIVTRYDDANDFINGLAKVGKKTTASGNIILYGFIDKKGIEIIPLIYPSANLGLFQFGLIKAKDPETNRYGYYDKTGKWVLPPTYLDATNSDYLGGLWVKMTDGKFHYITKTGKDFGSIDSKGEKYYFFGDAAYTTYEDADKPYVLIDKNGKVLKTIDSCDGIYSYSEGIAGYKSKPTGLYGFLDLNGNTIIPAAYNGFTGFTDGVSKVSQSINSKTKSGYLNSKNEIFLPIRYDTVYGFNDNWGLIKNNGTHFFVDNNGNLKDPPRKYDQLLEFRSGFALGKINGSSDQPPAYYYINTQLKEQFSISARQAYLFYEDVAVVSRDDKTYELMNKKGEIFKTLTGIETLKFCMDGMLAARENGKWGFINDKGDMRVNAKYDSTDSFKNGYGRIKMGLKWGIVDKSGTEIFEPKYDNILPGENGLFIFYDKQWGVMDKSGKILIPPNYSTITPFQKEKALAKLNKTFTIIKSPLMK